MYSVCVWEGIVCVWLWCQVGTDCVVVAICLGWLLVLEMKRFWSVCIALLVCSSCLLWCCLSVHQGFVYQCSYEY